jgi:Domain of unknown function (DUF4350)
MSSSRRLVALGVALLVVLVALRVANELTRDGQRAQGPPGSSYARGPYGASAYASLLRRSGHQVARLRDRLRDLDLDPRFTVVLLYPDVIDSADAAALARFVRRGGRLVVADEQPARWLNAIVPDPPGWAEMPLGVTHALAPLPETSAVHTIAPGVGGRFVTSGSAAPAVGDATASLAAVEGVGAGRAVLLADASPLLNSRLAARDDAALALAVAGAGRPVAFVESVHGYGRASGWGALPGRFRGALVLLALAGGALALARGRRLGPAQPARRALAPARSEYAEGLAGALVRADSPEEAIAPVVAEARDRLLVSPGGGDDEVLAAALAAGLSEDEAHAIAYGAPTRSAALAAARGLARINERGGER